MSSREHAPGTTEETEQALMQALKRVVSGKPREERNAKLAGKGKLRVTIANVAREAGRSRTLIGSDRCPYSEVRKAVLAAMDGGKGTGRGRPTAAELVRRLREDKARLESEVRVLATRLHDAFLHTVELQKQCKRLKSDLADAKEKLRKAGTKPKEGV
jgi:phage shock protein A